MKRRLQKGSAHVILTIILGVGLVGAIGWIFWQNFVSKDDSAKVSTSEDSNKKTPKKEAKETDPNEGYLVIKEWGVRFKIPSSLSPSTIGYEKSDVGDGYLDIYSTLVKSELANCLNKDQGLDADGSLISMYRKIESVEGPDSYQINKEPIAGYYYGYNNQAAYFCFDEQVRQRSLDELKKLDEMLKTLELAKL